jgi:hypothetical protein|tara:strand:- start:759 stop:1358 length:600 start_codon:yes stop_codon:yes gene_type:complete
MPKFYRQNKKKIDPRYFLHETTNRDNDLYEGFDIDKDDDNQISGDELRALADELESRQSSDMSGQKTEKGQGPHSRGIDKMVDMLTGQGSYYGDPKDPTYGNDPENLRSLLEKIINDPDHGWNTIHPSDFTGEKNQLPILMKVLIDKGVKQAREEGSDKKISLQPDEQEMYEWLRRKLGYRADMGKGMYVDTKSDMYGE